MSRGAGRTPDHLVVTRSDRGFDRMPAIPGRRAWVEVYESSAASGPHVWVKVTEKADEHEYADAHAHLTAEAAWQLADQLRAIVEHHYQGCAIPGWAPERWGRRRTGWFARWRRPRRRAADIYEL